MKLALLVASAVGLIQAHEKVHDTKDFVLFTEGFLKGTLDAEGFTDIEHCIQDGERVVQDAEKAFTDFKSHDIHDIVDGFEQIADALKTIKTGMADCSSIKADWEKLEQIAEAFASPLSLIWHIGKDLIHNGVPIYHEISTAVDDYDKKDWKDFGYQCGLAAAHVFIGEESQQHLPKMEKEKVAMIYQGLLDSYGGHFNLEALLVCIGDEDQAALMLDVAVQAFEEAWQKKEIGDAIGGIIAVVGAIQEFKQGLPACEAIDTSKFDYKALDQSLSIAVDPMDHFKLLEEDLQVHGKSVLEDIGTGVKAYRRGDYVTFGRQMGTILRMATKKNDSWGADKPKDKNLYLY